MGYAGAGNFQAPSAELSKEVGFAGRARTEQIVVNGPPTLRQARWVLCAKGVHAFKQAREQLSAMQVIGRQGFLVVFQIDGADDSLVTPDWNDDLAGGYLRTRIDAEIGPFSAGIRGSVLFLVEIQDERLHE